VSEEEELFPDGNFEDYWLGDLRTNTRLSDNEGWVPAEGALRAIRDREQWTPNRDMISKILGDRPNAVDQAGGILGVSPEFYYVRARLLART